MNEASLATRLQAALQRRRAPRTTSFFEFWPGYIFYAPVALFWIAQAIRYRSITLPALCNPRIEAGGICGESKTDILLQVTDPGREWITPFVGITTLGAPGADHVGVAEAAMREAKLTYPIVAKPDMSCNGAGVRVIRDRASLAFYLAEFPRATRLQLQQLVTDEGEAGIFYMREPGAANGRITSITLKYPPTVTGDGLQNIKTLIEADARLRAVSTILLPKLGAMAATIPATGESVQLVFVGNHCRGSTFKDGRHLATDALTARIDAIARSIPDFHFGRFDVKFSNVAALRQGEGFRIIEVNGAGSEATHIWDPETSIVEAYRTQFFHYGSAFRIGATMRANGVKRYGMGKLLRAWLRQRGLMARYPTND